MEGGAVDVAVVVLAVLVSLERLADGVGAGEGGVAVAPFGERAADAFELFVDRLGLDAGAEREGNQPADGLGLGVDATTGAAHAQEGFAEALFVLINRDKEGAAAGLDPLGDAFGEHRAGAGTDGAGAVAAGGGGGRRGGGLLLDGRGRLFAGGEDLEVAGAVAVDRDAFAAQLPGELVDLADLFLGGFVAEVDRLGDGVVGGFLEGGLHPHMPLR